MKKFENIYIASDIDGTFLWDCGYVNPKNIKAVKYFTENGGHFTFSTGRNPFDTDRVIPYWRSLCNMPGIFCNGSMLYDPTTNNIMDPRYITPKETAVKVFSIVRENFSHIAGARATTSRGFLFADDDEFVMRRFTANGNIHVSEILPFEEIDGSDIFKIVVETTREDRETIYKEMEKYFGGILELTYSAPTLVEIQPLGVTKAFQVERLKAKAKEKDPNAKVYCIGDYNNDYSMLLAADVAVCPENASDNIKAISQVITCHCKDGAIADLIDKIEKSI